MALIQFHFESRLLNGNTLVNVVLPDLPNRLEPKEFYGNGKKYPVLWLLHGTFGDATDWVRRTNIELYACERNVIVVMPSALNSNYSNWDNVMMGYKMFDFLTEELMPIIHNWFPASSKREDNFIAGLSMGGGGTIKYAVNRPELFAGAAVLSSAPSKISDLTEEDMNDPNPRKQRQIQNIKNAGGLEAYKNSYENTWDIIDKLNKTGTLPKLFFACGLNDMLLERYKVFKEHALEIGLDAEFFEAEGYKHEWRFWDLSIQKALDFFGLDKTGDSKF